eukprot:68933_1
MGLTELWTVVLILRQGIEHYTLMKIRHGVRNESISISISISIYEQLTDLTELIFFEYMNESIISYVFFSFVLQQIIPLKISYATRSKAPPTLRNKLGPIPR